MVVQDTTRVKDYLNKTKLKTLDYVINPYVGCPHKCLYCYAAYMASFSKHKEEWGNFVDVKYTRKKINTFKIKNKKVMISTVTDPYNYFEKEFKITRNILEQLENSEGQISIVTKSKLVLRDLDILKKIKHLKVALSFSTLDENLKQKLEPCSDSISERLETLKILKKEGIYTVLYIAPLMPELTDYKSIIDVTKDYVDEYWYETLNLRSSFKTKMMAFINLEYPELNFLYTDIYVKNQYAHLEKLSSEISAYCTSKGVKHINMNAGD